MTLLIIGSRRSEEFAAAVRAESPGVDLRIWPDTGRVEDIKYALAWGPPPGALKTLPNLKLIVSVGAGVDHLMKDPELPRVPVVRFVDPDLTGRMVSYVVLQVLFHQRRMCEFLEQQRGHEWKYHPEPRSEEVRVGLMGLGVMGQACAEALRPLGFPLRGWSRSRKDIEGVTTFAGAAEFDTFLAETDILVCTLPSTPDTRGILNRNLFRKLSRQGRTPRLPGPVLINAGRGALQVEADIVAALDEGDLYAASLDVFETEPLPPLSPLWDHPRVVITPHNAAETSPPSIAAYLLRQIRAYENGEPLRYVVDPERGY